jgi:hypothetical protein
MRFSRRPLMPLQRTLHTLIQHLKLQHELVAGTLGCFA